MTRKRFHILVTEPMGESAMARLSEVGEVITLDRLDEDSLVAAVPHAHALIVRSATCVTEPVIAAAKRLRVIGRAGVGLDQIDVSAARAAGIRVVYTPAASTDAVAELTVGLIIALERQVMRGHSMVIAGEFARARRELIGRELRGLTLGIVGMGRIGSAVARICGPGLGMGIIYNDIQPIALTGLAARSVDKLTLYHDADVVSLHVPLTDETRHMISVAQLARFKPTSTLVNTSRGAVVCTGALADALRERRLAGAALDVLETEPPPPDYPLLDLANVILTPHLGARTALALERMENVVDDVIAVLENRQPTWCV